MKRKLLLRAISWGSALGFLLLVSDALPPQSQRTASDLAEERESSDSLAAARPLGDIADHLIDPFVREAKKRREERLESDPSYAKRIDWELNQDRINLLLYGYGETHEPPITERAFIGSFTIISYRISSRKIDFISLTHDIRAPEIERYKIKQGRSGGWPIRLDRAYPEGGFELTGLTLEDATSLSMDFQFAFPDMFIRDLIDEVFEGVEVEVTEDFGVAPFYLEGRKYPEGRFSKGKEKLSGLRALQFIKTVPKVPKGSSSYPKSLEHNVRKHLVTSALIKSLENRVKDPIFLLRLSGFLKRHGREGKIAYDFAPDAILINRLGTVAAGIGKSLLQGGNVRMPKIGKTVYIADVADGDGGVRWVAGSQSPAIRRELQEKRYPHLAFVVPYQANPFAEDLVAHYWPSVRNRVKQLMSEK